MIANKITILGSTLLIAWSATAEAGGKRKKGKKVQSAYSAFDEDRPAEQIDPDGDGTTGASADALAVTSSLPLQIAFEGDAPLAQRQIPPTAPAGRGAARTFRVGECQVELTTGPLAVSTHQLYPNGRFYVSADSLLRGATVRGEVGTHVYLSVATDLSPRVIGDAAAQQACAKRLKRGSVQLGRATLDGTRISAAGGGRTLTFAKAGEAQGRVVYLVWDKTLGRAAVRDADGMMVQVESPVFAARGDAAGHFDLDVRAEFAVMPDGAAAQAEVATSGPGGKTAH